MRLLSCSETVRYCPNEDHLIVNLLKPINVAWLRRSARIQSHCEPS